MYWCLSVYNGVCVYDIHANDILCLSSSLWPENSLPGEGALGIPQQILKRCHLEKESPSPRSVMTNYNPFSRNDILICSERCFNIIVISKHSLCQQGFSTGLFDVYAAWWHAVCLFLPCKQYLGFIWRWQENNGW